MKKRHPIRPTTPLVFILGAFLCSTGTAQTPVPQFPKPRVPDMSSDLTVSNLRYVGCDQLGANVRNSGNLPIVQPFNVSFVGVYPGGEAQAGLGEVTLQGLTAFATATPTSATAAAGYMLYFVRADSTGAVAEANATNNEAIAQPTQLVNCPNVSVRSASNREGAVINFVVTLSHAFAAAVSVNFETRDVSAVGGATCGSADYVTARGTLVFPAGTTTLTQTVPVQTCSDTVADGSETFSLRLRGVTNGRISSGAGATGTIAPFAF